MAWLEALVLGLVQGITEFLPVSSDGHLLLTQSFFAWLTGQGRSGKENLFFDVILHLGTTAAILVLSSKVDRPGLARATGSAGCPCPAFSRAEVVRVGSARGRGDFAAGPVCAFLQEAAGARRLKARPWPGIGFLVTAAVLLLTAWLSRRDGAKGPAETTWLDALLIGIAQMFAPLPGVSRSGLTIAAALALGLSRTWAVGFSLLIAVPAILGAACYEIERRRWARIGRVDRSDHRSRVASDLRDGPGGGGWLLRDLLADEDRADPVESGISPSTWCARDTRARERSDRLIASDRSPSDFPAHFRVNPAGLGHRANAVSERSLRTAGCAGRGMLP